MLTVACDKFFEDTNGPSAPRLSASLNETYPGSPTFALRAVVNNPAPGEYLGLAVSGGATLSFGGSPPSSSLCAAALGEQAFEIASIPGTPIVTVALGTWAGTGTQPPSACAASPSFHVEESVIASVPSAMSTASLDAGSMEATTQDDAGAI
jgi:hypothetical protein